MKKIPELTKSELSVMKILWKGGSMTVREVQDLLKEKNNWAYTTTKTTMDRMANKGFIKKEKFHGIFIYKPIISKVEGMYKWVEFFTRRFLEVDYKDIVPLFAKGETLTEKEIEELTKMLEDADKENYHDK